MRYPILYLMPYPQIPRRSHFWFTFSGSPMDVQMLVEALAFWVGKRTSIWQIYEDLRTRRVSAAQAFDRLAKVQTEGSLIVLDDCHKQADRSLFERIGQLACSGWRKSHLIAISEEKLPEMGVAGAEHFLVEGLEPKEAVEFAAKRGTDLSIAMADFLILAVQIGGHPLMLSAVLEKLPTKPSRADIRTIQKEIPKIRSVSEFLQALSDRVFFDLVKTDAQRNWLKRLSVLTSAFTLETALAVAHVVPKVPVDKTDWNYLSSRLFEEVRSNHHVLPHLIREVSSGALGGQRKKEILIAAARHFFKSTMVSRKADFQDFYGAIVHLLMAGEHVEAAVQVLNAIPSFLKTRAYQPFEMLFVILNGEAIQGKIPDHGIRFSLLGAEFSLRLAAEETFDPIRALELIRQMRSILRRMRRADARNEREIVLLAAISLARGKQLQGLSKVPPQKSNRLFTPFQLALKIALSRGESRELLHVGDMYSRSSTVASKPSPTVLRQIVLASCLVKRSLVPGTTVDFLYGKYALGAKDTSRALTVLEEHSKEFEERGLVDEHFACEHAAGLIIHERFGEYGKARQKVYPLYLKGAEAGLSPELLAKAELFIADTFWAEDDHVQSAEFYQRAVGRGFTDAWWANHARIRLLDSFIKLAKYQDAVALAVVFLRRYRNLLSEEQRFQIYIRIAYASAELGKIKQAAIACWRLCRQATQYHGENLKYLSIVLSGWVLQHLQFSDKLTPIPEMKIRDSNAFSDPVSSEALDRWRMEDPLEIKATCMVAATFEFLGELRRSEGLFRVASQVFEQAPLDNPIAKTGSIVVCTKLTRIQLNRGRTAEAAVSLRSAIAKSVEYSGMKASVATWALWETIEPQVHWPADRQISEFFLKVAEYFPAEFDVKAWLSYLASGILSKRKLVAESNRRLSEAEQFAESGSDTSLLMSIRTEKLFVRAESMFPNHMQWFTEALRDAVYLTERDDLQEARTTFGQNIRTVALTYSGTIFGGILDAIEACDQQFSDHPFEVALYALWKVGTVSYILSSALPKLLTYLKQNAPFLPV